MKPRHACAWKKGKKYFWSGVYNNRFAKTLSAHALCCSQKLSKKERMSLPKDPFKMSREACLRFLEAQGWVWGEYKLRKNSCDLCHQEIWFWGETCPFCSFKDKVACDLGLQ